MKITAIEPFVCDGGGGGLGGARHLCDPVRGNAHAARASATGLGDGLHAYVVADPTDLAGIAVQIRRYLGAPGVLGVKVHGERSGTPTASKAMADLFGW